MIAEELETLASFDRYCYMYSVHKIHLMMKKPSIVVCMQNYRDVQGHSLCQVISMPHTLSFEVYCK